jgi:hypothetical protein
MTGLAAVAAATGLAWRVAFGWWARRPSLWWFEKSSRWFGQEGPVVVMLSDLLFAVLCGLLLAEVFIRLLRPRRYLPELIAVVAFLAAALTAAQLDDESAGFLLQLPPLWVTLMVFGIRVGYGIKAGRQRAGVVRR